MPLTPAKLAHIAQKRAITRQGRTTEVTLTLKNSDGSISTLTVPGMWRPSQDQDDLLPDPGRGGDVLASFLQSDVTLAQLRACIHMTNGAPTAAEPATTYSITHIDIRGMQPGGDQYLVQLERES